MLAEYASHIPLSCIFSRNRTVISGFNTDVKYQDVVYHVQTEDKGPKTRVIVSLIYDRGTILASKRSSYEDIANGTIDEKILAEKLQKQHKLICAAIKAGRINDLKAMGEGDGKKQPAPSEPMPQAAEFTNFVPESDLSKSVAVVDIQNVVAIAPPAVIENEAPAAILMPEEGHISGYHLEMLDEGPIFDAVSIVEEELILSDEAVAVVSELSGTERPTNNKLSLELLGETKFKGGERRDVLIMVCKGTDRRVVNDAQIMIKVLGSSFRPLIFHAKTDKNGLAKVHLQLPHFQAGRAALLVRVISNGEELELRRIVTPG